MNIEITNRIEDVIVFLTYMSDNKKYTGNKYSRFELKYANMYKAIKVDGIVVGCLNLQPINETEKSYAYSIGILNMYRRRGIARAVIDMIFDIEDIKYLYGTVHKSNIISINFHKDCMETKYFDDKYKRYVRVRD